MTQDNKTIYRTRIDLWVWCVMFLGLAVIVVATIGTYWWLALLYGVLIMGLFAGGIFGTRYEISGDKLIVYQFFRAHTFPINKIKEVKKTTGYLATAGASRKRVSIKFTDRSVMKSSMPLEISPKDRDGFIAQLKQINPAIATG